MALVGGTAVPKHLLTRDPPDHTTYRKLVNKGFTPRVISQLEGLSYVGPGGYVYIRSDNHQGYKDAMTGFTKNYPAYQFQTMDTNRVIVIPIRSITAPPGWKGTDPTRTYDWINKTWPKVTG